MDDYDEEIRALLREERPRQAPHQALAARGRAAALLLRALLVTAFLVVFACGAYELFIAG